MPDLLPFAGVFLGLIGLLAGAVFVARSTISKETINELNKLVDAQDKRIAGLEKEVDKHLALNAALESRVADLEKTKDELFEQLRQAPAFAEIAREMVTVSEKLQSILNAILSLTRRMDRR